MPDRALTMGISTILKAKKIILLASGKKKHNAVTSLLTKDILTESPATMLKVHNDAVIKSINCGQDLTDYIYTFS